MQKSIPIEKTGNLRKHPVGQARPEVSRSQMNPALLLGVQRALADPSRAAPNDILALQRAAGNQAVSRLIQAKLTVGPAGDRYEQEADRVAEQVLSMPLVEPRAARNGQAAVQRHAQKRDDGFQTRPLAASITPLLQPARDLTQRQEDEEEIQTKRLQRQEDEEEVQTKPLVQRRSQMEEELQAKPLLQRQLEEEEVQTKPLVQRRSQMEEELRAKSLAQRQVEEEEVQTKPVVRRQADGGFEAGSQIESQLAGHKEGGAPLPGDLRSFMEPRFGADFSGVRVHTGAEAGLLSRSLSAQAFTHGSNIYMGQGRYDPGSTAGKRLLAHELAHVVQQGAAPAATLQSKPARGGPKPVPLTKTMAARKELVQRVIIPYSKVNRDWNLADKQAALDGTLGFCPPVVNAVECTSAAKTIGALSKPMLSVTPGQNLQYEAEVVSVPVNIAGWEMNLPKPGPWRHPKANKDMMCSYAGVHPKKRGGTINLEVEGVPDHKGLLKQIEAHENVHASDNMNIIAETLGAWDEKIRKAQANKTKFYGPTAALAEEAAYNHFGGTTTQIGTRLDQQWGEASDAYHNTPEGKTLALDPKLSDWHNRLTFVFRLTARV